MPIIASPRAPRSHNQTVKPEVFDSAGKGGKANGLIRVGLESERKGSESGSNGSTIEQVSAESGWKDEDVFCRPNTWFGADTSPHQIW